MFVRMLQRLLSVAVSELGIRLAIAGGVILGLVSEVVIPSERAVILGFLAALAMAGFLDFLRRMWEFRREEYSARAVDVRFQLSDRGRRVMYERKIRIRCKLPNLHEIPFRYAWDGETRVTADRLYKVGHGYDLELQPDAPDANRGRILATFDPLRKWESKDLGFGILFREPHASYSKFVQYTVVTMTSPLSRLRFRFVWDDTVPVAANSIKVREYRTAFDRKDKEIAPLREHAVNKIRHSETAVEWSIRAIEPNRTYRLVYEMVGILNPELAPRVGIEA